MPGKLPLADVCVVGSGPAGISTALALGSQGHQVVLLESGGHRSSRRLQDLNDGDHEGVPYKGLLRTRHRRIGGTVNIWDVRVTGKPAAKYVPLSKRDLTGWPIEWEDLRSYYAGAQDVCGLGPFDYGAVRWTTESHRPFDLSGTGIASGVYQFGLATQFTQRLVGKVQATDQIVVLPRTTAIGLTLGDSGRVKGVRVAGEDSRTREIRASVFVLACGAVENARLLLLAGQAVRSRLPWLGRGFMEHARDFSMILAPPSPELFRRASFYDLRRSEEGFWVGGRLHPTDDAVDTLGLPNASVTLVAGAQRSVRGSRTRRLLRRIRRKIGTRSRGYGWSQARNPEAKFDVFKLVLNLEQQANRDNRVKLGTRTDRFGNALPHLFLSWTEEEQARLERFRGLLAGWLEDAGLGRLIIKPGHRPNLNAHHHAGTTRMGLTRSDGVVDPDGRVFGFDNLYVAGASVFPSAGFANPTLTIVAMSLRLAEHIQGTQA